MLQNTEAEIYVGKERMSVSNRLFERDAPSASFARSSTSTLAWVVKSDLRRCPDKVRFGSKPAVRMPICCGQSQDRDEDALPRVRRHCNTKPDFNLGGSRKQKRPAWAVRNESGVAQPDPQGVDLNCVCRARTWPGRGGVSAAYRSRA